MGLLESPNVFLGVWKMMHMYKACTCTRERAKKVPGLLKEQEALCKQEVKTEMES